MRSRLAASRALSLQLQPALAIAQRLQRGAVDAAHGLRERRSAGSSPEPAESLCAASSRCSMRERTAPVPESPGNARRATLPMAVIERALAALLLNQFERESGDVHRKQATRQDGRQAPAPPAAAQ